MLESTRHYPSSCRPEMVNMILLSMILAVNLWQMMDMSSIFQADGATQIEYNPTVQINGISGSALPISIGNDEAIANYTSEEEFPKLVRNDTEPLFFYNFLSEKYPRTKSFGDFGSVEEMHQQITHVYRLGYGHKFGRTNNNLHSVLHAFDMIFDLHGDPPNNKAVLAVEGWAADVLAKFFVQTSSSEVELSPEEIANMTRAERKKRRKNNQNLNDEWKRKLELVPPHALVHSDRIDALNLTEENGKILANISAKESYFYTLENYANLSAPVQEHRRRVIWGNLLNHTITNNLVGYSLLQQYLMEHFQTTKYIAIHARWMEGQCTRRVGSELSQDECYLGPSYINDLVHFANHTDLPIVFLSDRQREEIPINLRNDPVIGPKFVHLEKVLEVPPFTDVQNDMLIAMFSDSFIGTRMSTMATTIAMSRAIMGAEPVSNLLWIRPIQEGNHSGAMLRTDNGESLGKDASGYRNWHVCKQCAFVCNPEKSFICGEQPVAS